MKPGDLVRIKRASPNNPLGIITWASWKSSEPQSNYWACKVLWDDGRHVAEDAWKLMVINEGR